MIVPAPDALLAPLREHPGLARAYLVGGCVRDALLGIPSKDFDIEVYGHSAAELSRVLESLGRVDYVGRSFGVFKVRFPSGLTCDFSLPRRETKIEPGHKGFEIEADPDLTPEVAAARRDFTMNALLYDPREDRVIDFFGGLADLRNRTLRHVGPAFREDPLRVLRGMQFVSRFGLHPAVETLQACREMHSEFASLATERVGDEWEKWCCKSVSPSLGLRFLAATGWWSHFPEIRALSGVLQDPEWHPEGDVFVHTCHACDALVSLTGWQQADPEFRRVLSIAVLAHDFGKVVSTQRIEKAGRPRIGSPGHESTGIPLTESFLARLNVPLHLRPRVLALVSNHMTPLDLPSDRSVRRLAARLAPESIHGLCVLIAADHGGRPPLPRGIPPAVAALEARAHELAVRQQPPPPVLRGRHLLDLGIPPGPQMGAVLKAAYEAQLDGDIANLNDAWLWLRSHPPAPLSADALLAEENPWKTP